MNLDKYGLPCQANGDCNDQLQRVGMIDVAGNIGNDRKNATLYLCCTGALIHLLQPYRGIYTRFTGSDPANVSADQLIPALAAHVSAEDTASTVEMAFRMFLRLGFAQNYKDGLNGSTTYKVPDFMLFRALPLITRVHWVLYACTLIVDLYLICMSIGAIIYSYQSPDSVDQNNTVITLAVCSYKMPTPFSYLARKILAKGLAANLGTVRDSGKENRILGALRWYHRAEAGGNPEIAEMYKPICEEYFS